MKLSLEDGPQAADDLQALYAPVRAELEAVEAIVRNDFLSDDPFVGQLARHGFRLGGKRLRPALVLLSAKVCGAVKPSHLVLGAVMEVIHTATLLHDDVLDEAEIRRHLDTVNARWGNESSILLGDYLLALAIDKIGSLDSPFACRAIGQAAKTVCEGELRQVRWRGNFDLGEQDYMAIIADKTAELTACCCLVGAHYADGSPETCNRLAAFGRQIGIAFQIADDLLDMTGEETVVGKSLGSDLAKQKATLPLIRLLAQVHGAQRKELLEILTRPDNHRAAALRPWFSQSDAVAYAQAKAAEHSRRAVAQLDGLPASEACAALAGLAAYVVNRRQ